MAQSRLYLKAGKTGLRTQFLKIVRRQLMSFPAYKDILEYYDRKDNRKYDRR